MSQKNLAVYVNDHLAGATGALRLFDRIHRISGDEALVRRLAEVRNGVEEDRRTLDDLRRRLGIARSPLRQAGAAGLQVLSDLKFRLQRSGRGELQLLHALDSLSLGIQGKQALWRALAAGTEVNPRLRAADYAELVRRADGQLDTLRQARVEAARRAFSPSGDARPPAVGGPGGTRERTIRKGSR